MAFHDKLAFLMQKNGVTNYKLAKRLKCSQSSIKNWLDGNDPKLEYVSEIANFFDVSVDYLLDRENDNSPLTVTDEEALSEKDQRLLTWFRSLPPEKQKAILTAQDAPEGLV